MSKRNNIIIKEEQSINKFLYILDHTFVKKYCASSSVQYKPVKYDYLPIINTTKFSLEELSKSKFLIYLKCVASTKSLKAGFFGYFLGQKILINSKQEKQIKNSELVIIDDLEYKKMVFNYNLCDMDNLIFIRYEIITSFKSIIKPLKYKNICQENNIQFEKTPSRINCLNIVNYKIDEPIKYIEQELQKEEDEEDEEDEDEEDEDDKVNKEEENEEEKDIIMMSIPIVWNPCKIIINKMDNLSIKKTDIIAHYKKCDYCDITDNNRIKLEFENIKINLQIKEGDEGKKQVDSIINFYHNDTKYIEKKSIFDNNVLFEDRINMIYYKYEEEIYDKSFFIIKK
jgi:hypothetical protein